MRDAEEDASYQERNLAFKQQRTIKGRTWNSSAQASPLSHALGIMGKKGDFDYRSVLGTPDASRMIPAALFLDPSSVPSVGLLSDQRAKFYP